MKSKLIRIGNSRGVRLPKTLLEEAGLDGEVEIQARGRSIVITSASRVREGWADDVKRLADRDPGGLLDGPIENRFDREEWEW